MTPGVGAFLLGVTATAFVAATVAMLLRSRKRYCPRCNSGNIRLTRKIYAEAQVRTALGDCYDCQYEWHIA